LPDRPSHAASKQNDLRRMSNECAVDLVLVSDSSTRTVTSGSARHSVLTRSKISSGTSMGGPAASALLLTPNILYRARLFAEAPVASSRRAHCPIRARRVERRSAVMRIPRSSSWLSTPMRLLTRFTSQDTAATGLCQHG
jgi:hypothetical protein